MDNEFDLFHCAVCLRWVNVGDIISRQANGVVERAGVCPFCRAMVMIKLRKYPKEVNRQQKDELRDVVLADLDT